MALAGPTVPRARLVLVAVRLFPEGRVLEVATAAAVPHMDLTAQVALALARTDLVPRAELAAQGPRAPMQTGRVERVAQLLRAAV